MKKQIGIQDGESVKEYKKRMKKQSTKKETIEMNSIKKFMQNVFPWLVIFALTCAAAGYFVGHERGMQDQSQITKKIQTEVAAQLKDEAK